MHGKHFVFVCEMGGNYGHITPLLAVARQAAEAGAKISFVLPELPKADLIFRAGFEFQLFYSPSRWHSRAKSSQPPATFSETLLLKGYGQPERLAAAIHAWQSLLEAIGPDCIFFDFAPTAQIAAFELDCKKVTFGSGFWLPALTEPLSALPGRQADTHRRQKSDQIVLANVNAALAQLGREPLRSVLEIHKSDEQFLMTVAELDCYRLARGSVKYWGFLEASHGSRRANWSYTGNEALKPKIFGYLSTDFPFVKPLLELIQQHCVGNIFVSGKNSKTLEALSSSTLTISNEAFAVDSVMPGCDAVICHAGYSTVTQSLSAGKPIICIPLQYEQQLTAEALEAIGAGSFIRPEQQWQKLEPAITKALQNVRSHQEAAQRFQQQYQTEYPGDTAAKVLQRCGQLLAIDGY